MAWLVAVLGAVFVAALASSSRGSLEAPRPSPASTRPAAGLPERLDQLQWTDLATGRGVAATPERWEAMLAAPPASTAPPALYLRGLLLVGRGKPEQALAAFDLVPPEQVPPELVYAPYRLFSQVRPDRPNPYRARLRQAVSQGQAPTLVAARFEVEEGRPREALEAYLRTDPAGWGTRDVVLLGRLLHHAGVRNETWLMIRAAMRAGRVPRALRPALDGLVASRVLDPSPDRSKKRFLEALDSDPRLRAIAVESAGRLLSLRQAFVRREYRRLLDDHAGARLGQVADETLLLLTLAAAHEKDLAALDHWSRELRRRSPAPAVGRWAEALRAEAAAPALARARQGAGR